jgi:hypothetical protein
MADSINVNQNNNNVSLQDANGKVTITDNKLGTNVEVTQPVTNVVTVALIGPQGQPGETPSTGSFVLTSSFNAFTASYYLDSASFNTNILNNSSSISLFSESFEIFSESYNTGSFTGSFYGDGSNLTGIVSSKWTGSNPITREGNVEITGSLTISGSSTFINIGPAIFSGSVTSIGGFTGSLLGTADSSSYALTSSYALSTDISIDTGSFVTTSSFNSFTSSYNDTTGSFVTTSSFNDVTGSFVTTSSFDNITGSFVTTSSFNSFTSSYNTGSFLGDLDGTSSYSTNSITSSYVETLNQDVLITGSLTVLQGLTIYGSSSFQYITASQLDISASFISVNVFEPAQRFGGLIVYDSGSLSHQATASLAWDSLHNHWVYQNASGSTYTGGMLLSGPRNTGSLGDEPNLTKWRVPRSDGGDHLDDSQIYSSASIHIVTGSLTVTAGITGSLLGTSSWADNAQTASFVTLAQTASFVTTAQTASYVLNAISASYILQAVSSSYATTASYIEIAQTASYVQTAQTASYVLNSVSASYAASASYLIGGVTVITYIRRSDYTSTIDPNINYLYLGEAPSGSSESADVWGISRLSISSSGETLTQTTSSAAWTNRYSYTYS